jgi:pimeloyl-ACP methyl ester carboxylesterase
MRLFELAVAGLLLTGAVWSLIYGTRGKSILSIFLGLDLIALVLHLVLEGAHWQMAPVYLGVLVFAGLFLLRKPTGSMLTTGACTIIFLVLLTSSLSAILPMFRLPRPTGPYAIGTEVMYMVDQNRNEDAAPGLGRKRELMIQIWYPAAPSRNPYAPYRRRQETTLLSSYQSVLPTHSRWNSPIVQDGDAFPVLLYNPTWNGRRTVNTYLVEDLASHGFVVAGIDHTYNSEPVAFPDGRVVSSVVVKEMNFAENSPQTVEAAAQKEQVKQTADDIFVLDRLEAMNDDPKSGFHGRLDTDNAGAFGHSFGGSVSAQAAYRDPRIRAALDLDGALFGQVQRRGLEKPFMFIEEDTYGPPSLDLSRLDNTSRVNAVLDQNDDSMFQKSDGIRIRLHGSTHFSFTDKALFSPIKSLSGAGRISPRREDFIIRSYALAFFEGALKGKASPLLDSGKSPFPESSIELSPDAMK